MEAQKTTRFAISIDEKLFQKFDMVLKEKGYPNRSQAVQDLIRKFIIEEEWDEKENAMGTITLAFDHHHNNLSETLTAIQHNYHNEIISNMHAHLDTANCIEVIMVKGKGRRVRELANRLIATKGVKHGKLTLTTGGH